MKDVYPDTLDDEGRGKQAASESQAAPTKIDRYKIERELGQGTFGVVYLARDGKLNRLVAIKVPQRERLADADSYLTEARTLASLAHPNIVTIFDVGRTKKYPCFIVSQYIEGSDLAARMKQWRETPLPLEEAVGLVATVAEALHYAHSHEVFHRDIKPSNILLDKGGKPFLTDFGLALRDQDVGKRSSGRYVGTIAYMSPEQARGEGYRVDGRSDVFSLGIILYEMLTGKLPFRGESSEEVLDQIKTLDVPPPRMFNDRIPKELERACLKALEKRAADRYATALDMAEELRRVVKESADKENRDQGHRDKEERDKEDRGQENRDHPELPGVDTKRLALLYKRNAKPDEDLLAHLEKELSRRGHRVFVDRHMAIGVEWAKELEGQLRASDAVIPLLSSQAVQSEMLAYEVQTAHDEAQKRDGKPRLLPVRINFEGRLPSEMAGILDRLQYFSWRGPEDNKRLVEELLRALQNPLPPPPSPPPPPQPPEPVIDSGGHMPGGGVRIGSPYYVVRPTDQQFLAALARRDSVILLRGARQMGKTSLLGRGLAEMRKTGSRIVTTDFQTLNVEELVDIKTFYLVLGRRLADELDLNVAPEDVWKESRGPSVNFERFIRREILEKSSEPLVWAMDEVDRLFPCPFASEVFGLFRSWHNARTLQPHLAWSNLTQAIAYATEAHLFISDLNQSPFNVGTLVALEDFNLAQVADLNRRYGSPLKTDVDLQRFYQLLSGQPYLVDKGLYEMVHRGWDVATLATQAASEDGIFGDHLRRLLVLIARSPQLGEVMRGVLKGQPCPDAESFYRLRSAGVLSGDSAREVRPRCQLYRTYLESHLL